MPHESCVAHPTRDWYFNIRVDYYGITDGDHCAAAILSIFEYITSNTLEDMRSKNIPGEPWISISKQGLSDAMIDLFSERSILDAKQKLEAQNFIFCRNQEFTKGSCEYLLNYELVSEAIARYSASDASKIARRKFNTYASKIARDTETPRAKLRAPTAQNCAPPYKEVKHSYKTLEDLKTSPSTACIFPSETGASPLDPTGASPLDPRPASETVFADAKTTNVPSRDEEKVYDIGEGLGTENFILKAYKVNRGRKTTKTEIKHDMRQIQEAITASGDAEFRTGLLKYLDRDDEWVRARHWPLWGFLKNPSSYTRGLVIASASATTTQATGTWKVSSQPAANVPEPIPEPLPTVEYYVQNWNQSISRMPCDELLPYQRDKAEKATRDPQFRAAWPKITKKCALIAGNQEFDVISFPWLFLPDTKVDFKGGYLNWQGVLDGKQNYQLPKKPTSGKSVANPSAESSDATVARLRAAQSAKEAQARA